MNYGTKLLAPSNSTWAGFDFCLEQPRKEDTEVAAALKIIKRAAQPHKLSNFASQSQPTSTRTPPILGHAQCGTLQNTPCAALKAKASTQRRKNYYKSIPPPANLTSSSFTHIPHRDFFLTLYFNCRFCSYLRAVCTSYFSSTLSYRICFSLKVPLVGFIFIYLKGFGLESAAKARISFGIFYFYTLVQRRCVCLFVLCSDPS